MNIRPSLLRPWFLVVTGGVALPVFFPVVPAHAQKKGRRPAAPAANNRAATPGRAPSVAPAPAMPARQPVASIAINVNVLILAMDDVPVPGAVAPGTPSSGNAAPTAPRVPTPIRPIAPAITPTTWPALRSAQPVFVASAKKKPEVDKDAHLFQAVPEPWVYPPKAGGDAATSNGDATAAPLDGGAPNDQRFSSPSSGGVNSIENGPFAAPARPPGPVATAAASLHLALLRAGFQDVASTPLDGSILQPFLNNRRLSTRVLNNLSGATRQWLATVADEAPGTRNAAANTVVKDSPRSDVGNPQSSATGAPDTDVIGAASRIGQALGYRAVVVMSLAPRAATVTSTPGRTYNSTYALMIVDAQQESGEPLVFEESGDNEEAANEAAAATGAAIIARRVVAWPSLTEAEKKARADKYYADARLALAGKDYASAQDSLNQVLAFDPNRAEAFTLLGDILQNTDPAAAVPAYRRALTANDKDGEVWAKTAIAYTIGPAPSWPEALRAARRALELGWDTAPLRQAMATAQLGRAVLFRNAGRTESAEKAETEAREHLDRALELAPDDPTTTRLMTQQLLQQGRTAEALQLLDRLAVQYPDDPDIQNQYATALMQVKGRDEDAFAAWARARKLSGDTAAPVQPADYPRLSEGFDVRLANIGKRAGQLAAGVATNTTPRETALLQIGRFKDDMAEAVAAIKAIPPSFDGQGGNIHASRIFAADLLSQALEAHALYLETGQDLYRTRANEMHRQAIVTLNAARTAIRR